jgi:hypothetical protein
MSAAQLALARKSLAEQLSQLRGGAAPACDAAAVKRGRYLGQVERKQQQQQQQQQQPPLGPQGGASSDLTDAEFAQHLEVEEHHINHTQVVLDLLLQAQAMHLRHWQATQPQTSAAAAPGGASPPGKLLAAGSSSGAARGAVDRVSARLAQLIAEQQAETHNLTAARKLLLQVAYAYRRCVSRAPDASPVKAASWAVGCALLGQWLQYTAREAHSGCC